MFTQATFVLMIGKPRTGTFGLLAFDQHRMLTLGYALA